MWFEEREVNDGGLFVLIIFLCGIIGYHDNLLKIESLLQRLGDTYARGSRPVSSEAMVGGSAYVRMMPGPPKPKMHEKNSEGL